MTQTPTVTERLLTVNETAEYLRISRETVYRLQNEGHIQYVTVGKRRRYRIEDLNAYLERTAA